MQCRWSGIVNFDGSDTLSSAYDLTSMILNDLICPCWLLKKDFHACDLGLWNLSIFVIDQAESATVS